jgi:hypothetical protein
VISDSKELYELGGKPIDKMAALGLGYGGDWLKKLPVLIHRQVSNKVLQKIVAAGLPGLSEEARAELEKRAKWAAEHKEELLDRHMAGL